MIHLQYLHEKMHKDRLRLEERHRNTLRLALPEDGNGNTLRLEFTGRKAWEYAQDREYLLRDMGIRSD